MTFLSWKKPATISSRSEWACLPEAILVTDDFRPASSRSSSTYLCSIFAAFQHVATLNCGLSSRWRPSGDWRPDRGGRQARGWSGPAMPFQEPRATDDGRRVSLPASQHCRICQPAPKQGYPGHYAYQHRPLPRFAPGCSPASPTGGSSFTAVGAGVAPGVLHGELDACLPRRHGLVFSSVIGEHPCMSSA